MINKAPPVGALHFYRPKQPIDGRDLLQITSGIRQIIDGDFHAFDASMTAHWILTRVGEGSRLYIETNDPKITERLKTRFQAVEERYALDRWM